MLAKKAVCFASISFSFILKLFLSFYLSQDLLDQFSSDFIGCRLLILPFIDRSDDITMAYSPPFVALAFCNGLKYCNSNFRRFNGNHFSTLCVNLMRFRTATPELMRVVGIHPLLDQHWSYFRYTSPRRVVKVLSHC